MREFICLCCQNIPNQLNLSPLVDFNDVDHVKKENKLIYEFQQYEIAEKLGIF